LFLSVQEETFRLPKKGRAYLLVVLVPRGRGRISVLSAWVRLSITTVSNGKVCYILLCSSSLFLHLVNSLIAHLISYLKMGHALISADEAFISISVILIPTDQISSTDIVYAIGEAGSTSTTGSGNVFSTNSLYFNL
jgi:hypothetical protein